ncbi:hypothetical protein [Microbacterium sp. UCD-TDU]|uniref:beta barrel domain-containing protein n=1 Tax=Microbacterium sp. UCD-TDU TaxID=1247714 RepID=UPI00037F1E51|nr:hypothetical protein [Microbacterium sp. UCD-TDU]EYT61648.1 hypothetical protein D514_0102290 [Microbacterium sp. UCD-TDU]
MTYAVGQTVMISRTYGKPEEGQVVKIGRKYGEARSGYRAMRFLLESGAEADGFGRVWTLEAWAERKELSELSAKLRSRGVSVVGAVARSASSLRGFLSVLDQNVADDD